jgi:hypothetical protein
VRTLREHIREWYRIALEEAIDVMNKQGYITYMQAHDLLQKHFDNFEKYYIKKFEFEIDPFSEEFVDGVYEEYYHQIQKIKDIRVVTLSEEEAGDLLEKEIYGFNEGIRARYLKDSKLKQV